MENQSLLKTEHAAGLAGQKVADGAAGGANAVTVDSSLVGTEPDASVEETAVKKRRGRPRKYDVGEAVISSPQLTLLAPHVSAEKRGRGRPLLSPGTSPNPFTTFGEIIDFDETSFKVHILKVNLGADIVQPIKSFSEMDVQYISVLCATGMVSKVMLCQPGSADTLLTYEGCFQILTLHGLFPLGEKGAAVQCQPDTLNVLLSKVDGEVFGGVVAGPLIAAGPIQILIGTLKSNVSNRKNLKRRHSPKLDAATTIAVTDSGNVRIKNARTSKNNGYGERTASENEDLIQGGE